MEIDTQLVDKIRKIREKLPHGSQKKIAKKTKLSYIYVGRVLAGNHFNSAVIQEAINILKQQEEKNKRLEAEIDSVLE